MERIRVVVLAVLTFAASAAQAASISLEFDQSVYTPGDTGTLTVTFTTDTGELDNAVFGELRFTAGSALANPIVTQFALQAFGIVPWTLGTTPCNTSTCTAFNQITSTGVNPVPVDNGPFVIATVTFDVIFGSPHTHYIDVTWNAFDFFGAPTPAGACAVVGIPEAGEATCGTIPEPATGAMPALGLVALATAAPRRTR